MENASVSVVDRLPFGGFDADVSKAMKIVPNAGLHDHAIAFVRSHPRAIQYLEQAPVMVTMSGGRTTSGKLNNWYQIRLVGPCERGVPLKEMMANWGLPYPLRKLKGYALSTGTRGVVGLLAKLDPVVIGRIIPEKPGKQRNWMTSLKAWVEYHGQALRTRQAPLRFQWAAENIADGKKGEVRTVADFVFRSGADFNEKWCWNRAHEEACAWHDRMTSESLFKQLPFPPDTQIDFSPHPDLDQLNGYDFVALRTPRAIADEGAAMRHCVGSYIQDVMNRKTHIVSVRHGTKRVATLEMSPGPRRSIRQLKGRFNAEPDQDVRAAVDWYVHDVNLKLKPGKETQ